MKHSPRQKRSISERHENTTVAAELKNLSQMMSDTMIKDDAAFITVTAQIEGTPYSIFGVMGVIDTPERLIALQQAVDIVVSSWEMESFGDVQ